MTCIIPIRFTASGTLLRNSNQLKLRVLILTLPNPSPAHEDRPERAGLSLASLRVSSRVEEFLPVLRCTFCARSLSAGCSSPLWVRMMP
jgi:hypothetical protein